MVGLVIGASKESIHAIKTAQKAGIYVVAIDGNASAEGLKYANERYVVDISDLEAVFRITERFKPDIVLPVPIGRYLTTIGAVNDYYQLKGISFEAATKCTDKWVFHRTLNKFGLRECECILVPSKACLSEITGLSFPLIIKPRYGSGSRKVVLLENHEELMRWYTSRQHAHDEDFVLETAVKGTEYGLDGAVIDGQFQLILLRKKVLSPPPARVCVGYTSVISNENNANLFRQVETHLSAIIQVLQLDHCIIHADLIIKNESIFVIELSGRPAGLKLYDLFTPLATGVDLIEEYIKYVKGDFANFKPLLAKQLAIRYFDFENCRIFSRPSINILKEKYNLLEYECNIEIGAPLGLLLSGQPIIDRGYFIVVGCSEEEVVQQCNAILHEFQIL